MDINTVCAEIRNISTEAELTLLISAVRDRQATLRRRAANEVLKEIEIGSRVQIVGGRPQYINGLTGTVTAIKNSRAAVKLDGGPTGKFRSGQILTPFQLLALI